MVIFDLARSKIKTGRERGQTAAIAEEIEKHKQGKQNVGGRANEVQFRAL